MRTKLRAVVTVESAVVIFFLLAVVPRVSAQSIPVDTARAEGFKDGEKAAQKRGVGARFGNGFSSGFVAGFSAPFAIFGGSPQGFLIGGAGVSGIVASAELGTRHAPDSLVSLAGIRGQGYRSGFEDGYSTRLRSRRRSAALIGGVIGVGAGVGTLYYLVLHFFPYT